MLHCREKTNLLLEKLEALYIGLSRLSQLGIKRADYYAGAEAIGGLKKVRGTRLTDEVSVLQSFYFKTFRQPLAGVMKQNGKVLELLGGPNRAIFRKIVNDEVIARLEATELSRDWRNPAGLTSLDMCEKC